MCAAAQDAHPAQRLLYIERHICRRQCAFCAAPQHIRMIKFIASDLDGTLLPPTKIMPEETFGYIRKLKKMGVTFAPASGRQLPNLKKLFAPVLDDIAIIAENGGLAWADGKIIFSDPTPAEDVKHALDVIADCEGLYPLLSCADCAYYSSGFEPFVTVLNKSYSAAMRVDDLKAVADSQVVLKISVWDSLPCAEHGGVMLPPLLEGMRAMISGYDWMDVSAPQANKGRAFEALLRYFGTDAAESVAFGDHMNDYEMLCAAGRAYVTANAFPALKAKIGEEIGSNRENSVIKKIGELMQL